MGSPGQRIRRKGSAVNEPYLKTGLREGAAWLLAVGGVAIFLVCLAAEHALAPSLDPARHQVSEYVHAAGPVMVAGFLAWAVSLGATALTVWRWHRARLLAALFSLASFGMVLTACFATQTSAGALPSGTELTATGRLHDLGSGLTTLTLLAAAIAAALRIRKPHSFRRRTFGLIAFAALSSSALLMIGPEVGGIRQRLVILIGCLWQLLLLATLRRQSTAPSG